MNRKFRMGNRLIIRGFLLWILTLIIPLLLFFLFLYIQYGDNLTNAITQGYDPLKQYSNSPLEKATRSINVWASEEPDFDDLEALVAAIDVDEKIGRVEDAYIFARKGDQLKSVFELNETSIMKIQEDFEDISIAYLPKYGEFDEETNVEFVEKTGYVIIRQIDFRYADDEKGSIYIIVKYSNIPYEIMTTLGNNLVHVVGFMMIINILIAIFIIKKTSGPVDKLSEVMGHYKNDDFSKRLPELDEKKMLYVVYSAVNEMAASLEENKILRENLEDRRKEFLARISHDTKTPLASIRAHAEAMRDGYVTDKDKQKKYINNIISKVHSLDNMINELNVYSDLEAGVNQYNFDLINIDSYLQDVIEELKYDYDDHVRLKYRPNPSGKIVLLDVQRFHRVMMNLIGNSVKYGGRDIIEINVTLSYEDNMAVISVRDNGQGIDIEYPNDLMASFKRGDSSRDPNNSGSGLGLAIVKTIVDKHQGQVNVYSDYGEYFEVKIHLPVEEA